MKLHLAPCALILASAVLLGCGKGREESYRVSLLPQVASVRGWGGADVATLLDTAGRWKPIGQSAIASGQPLELPPNEIVFAEFWMPQDGEVELEFAERGAGEIQVKLSSITDEVEGAPRESLVASGAKSHTVGGPGVQAGRALLRLVATESGSSLSRMDLRLAKRPINLVFISIDTLRGDFVMGPDGVLEELDGMATLARDGVSFPRAYSHTTLTLPAHTSIFSSRMPHNTGVLINGQAVPAEVPLMPEVLDRAGYATLGVVSLPVLWQRDAEESLERAFSSYRHGKSRMYPAEQMHPLMVQEISAMAMRQPAMLFLHLMDPHDPYRAHGLYERPVEVSVNGDVIGSILSSDVMHWTRNVTMRPGENVLRLKGTHPFRLRRALPTMNGTRFKPTIAESRYEQTRGIENLTMHWEFPGAEPAVGQVELLLGDVLSGEELKERYELEVRHVDHYIGLLIESLKQNGLYDDALIVLTSDHGEFLGERGRHGHGDTVFDTVLHVPLIIKPPAGHPALESLRAARDGIVRHIDLAPTILNILDLPPLEGQMGTSLLEDEPRVLICESYWGAGANTYYGIRDEQFKMVYDVSRKAFELYDVALDPSETYDVFAERSSERPAWKGVLLGLANRDLAADTSDFSEELIEELSAMGYGGDE